MDFLPLADGSRVRSFSQDSARIHFRMTMTRMALVAAIGAAGCAGAGDSDVGGSGGATVTGTGGSMVISTGGATVTATGGATVTSSGGAVGTGGAGTGGRASTGGEVGTGGAGTGGRVATGGAVGTGGAGTGGRAATGGAPGTGGAVVTGGATGTGNAALCKWPTATGTTQMVSASIPVSGNYDGGMKRYVGSGALGNSGQTEGQDPLFNLSNGATLQNVIIGNPAADGVHCAGTCTLKNVWWEDVGEDAATLKGTSTSQVMTIDGGGAKLATDKVFQHNGPGTMVIKNFCAQDFGKLYRSCGNCSTQYARHVQMENIMVIPGSSTAGLAGVNANYKDTASFKNITVQAKANSLTICQRYTGNNSGAEPPKSGAGPDGTVCLYAESDITWQ